MIDIRNSVTLHEARKAKRKPSVLVTTLIFIVVITSLANMPVEFADLQSGAISPDEFVQLLTDANPRGISFAMLLGTLLTILVSFFVVRVIEKRSMRSMGFKGTTFFKEYRDRFRCASRYADICGRSRNRY